MVCFFVVDSFLVVVFLIVVCFFEFVEEVDFDVIIFDIVVIVIYDIRLIVFCFFLKENLIDLLLVL